MTGAVKLWKRFAEKHATAAQFIVFFVLSNGLTVLQLIMMPVFKALFGLTGLADIDFRLFHIGQNVSGSNYYMFDYAAGSLNSGGGGGLAYFLAVEVTLAIAQVINFFAQRNITFKANNNILRAAMWYVLAYVGITLAAAAAQGLYKAPLYGFFMGLGGAGEGAADVVTMIINSAISFWVFFPIFKLIFKNDKRETAA